MESGVIDLHQETTIAASPTEVYAALLDSGAWWPHRSAPDNRVVLEPHIGGRFFEDWGGGCQLYGIVSWIEENTRLDIDGPIGLPAPTRSWSSFQLSESGSGTALVVVHKAVGAFSQETANLYDEGWRAVTNALSTHVTAD